jgi:hypothetical protein
LPVLVTVGSLAAYPSRPKDRDQLQAGLPKTRPCTLFKEIIYAEFAF